MTTAQKIKLGTIECQFDGTCLRLTDDGAPEVTLELTREQLGELFEFLAKSTPAVPNRRQWFRVPIVHPERIQTLLFVGGKSWTVALLDLSLNGLSIYGEATPGLEVEQCVILRLILKEMKLDLVCHLIRKTQQVYAFRFAESTYTGDGSPPAVLVKIFNELQRDWLSSHFRLS